MIRRAGESGTAEEVLQPQDPLTVLRGVGERRAESLQREVGLSTIRDLVLCFPRRHREVLDLNSPDEAAVDRLVRLPIRVARTSFAWLPGRRSLVTVIVEVGDGTSIDVRFFNQPYLKNVYTAGSERVVEGVLSRRGDRFALKGARFLGVDEPPGGPCRLDYPDVSGFSGQRFAALIQDALRRVDLAAWDHDRLPPGLDDEVPRFVDAVRAMHLPETVEDHERARRRFAITEAVSLFRRVDGVRRRRLRQPGPAVRLAPAVEERIRARFPFALTGDQEAALQKTFDLLAGSTPMGLLLQGDVGTGKTIVALSAALAVIAAGYQVAFLAPTELLAEQHCAGVRRWLAGSRFPVGLMTASLATAARDELDEQLRAGRPHLVFGTHALFAERTRFARLGLAIIDEQHRFGVEQRTELVRKGTHPHVLYLTATPIPRTLTLTLFGDLDVAVLRQRPPGHRPVPAFLVSPTKAGWRRILGIVERRIARSQQVFVVCPKIGEDGGKGGAVRMHRELSRRFACGLVHGQMSADTRQRAVDGFRDGACAVLVGTTVLEVGIDVPEATLMVVAGADRFGLATLHQLRGRVGRGRRRGLCILTGKSGPRTEAVCRTVDGFELAERDLALRGAGELMGRRQSGLSDLRALDPVADIDLLVRVRELVRHESQL